MPDNRQELIELWHQLNQATHDRFRPVFRELGLPPMALVILQKVKKEPGITVSELARRAETAKSHVSKVLDHLAGDGLLEKRPDPADQRLVRIFLTDRAVKRLDALEGQVRVIWSEVTAEIPPEQLDAIAGSLRALVDALRRPRPPKE